MCWDDPDVDWSAADLVAVRSTWDYDGRLPEFLAWAAVGRPSLLNGADLFAWNTDKSYLVTLGACRAAGRADAWWPRARRTCRPAIASYDIAVVKPWVGADGRGVVVFDGTDGGPADLDEPRSVPGPWVVQPLVESVRTDGEHSVFVLGGELVAQVRKVPARARSACTRRTAGRPWPCPRPRGRRAGPPYRRGRGASCSAHPRLRPGGPDPAADGTLAVSELEVTEPGLYLDVLPATRRLRRASCRSDPATR